MSTFKMNRHVYVVSSGWMWAGDTHEEHGRITLTRAVHLFGFKELGFVGAIEQWKDKRVDLRPAKFDVEIPAHCVIYRVPVEDSWGLR